MTAAPCPGLCGNFGPLEKHGAHQVLRCQACRAASPEPRLNRVEQRDVDSLVHGQRLLYRSMSRAKRDAFNRG